MKGCGICGGALSAYLDLYDDRYGLPGVFELYRCAGCGHKRLDADFTDEALSTLYAGRYPRATTGADEHRPLEDASGFRAWLGGLYSNPARWVPARARVLDIGCGLGESIGYHELRGCEVYGVEVDGNAVKAARRLNYRVHAGPFDPAAYEEGSFDRVTMAQVIEHMTDPVEALSGVRRVLKPGGSAVVSTPNSDGWGAAVFGRKWINWHAPYHLQHFTLKSMEMAALKAGLRLAGHRTITSSQWLYYQWLHLASYPDIGRPSAFWSSQGRLAGKGALIARFISFIHGTGLNHAVTRLFDGLGLGDNFVFVLLRPS